MNRLLLALLLTAPFGGCEAERPPATAEAEIPLAAFRAALPSTDWLNIDTPFAADPPSDAASMQAFTRSISVGVDAFAANISYIIQDIVDVAPVQTDGQRFAIWGPLTDPLSPATWRVTVRRADDGTMTHTLEGWPKAADPTEAVAVVWGEHRPNETGAQGGWTYDLTAGRALDRVAHESIGTVALSYVIEPSGRSVEARFTGVQGPRDPISSSTEYRYRADADGGGSFDFMANFDVDAPDVTRPRRELVQVRTRWLASGAGRADVLAGYGDLRDGVEAEISQCWSDKFSEVWQGFRVGEVVDRTEGTAADCVFDDTQRPQFDVDREGFADSDFARILPNAVDFKPGGIPIVDPVDEPAEYLGYANGAINGLEQYLGWVLTIFREITQYPLTSCEADACTWGPWTEWDTQRSTRVVVRRVDPNSYTYSLAIKAFGAPESEWKELVVGGFVNGETERHGQGYFDFDLALLRESGADDTIEADRLRAEFRRQGNSGEMAAWIDGVPGFPGMNSARYFLSTSPLGGRIDMETPADIHQGDPTLSKLELIEAVYRWRQDGAGEGTLRISKGDVGGFQSLLGIECWDARGASVHRAFEAQPVTSETLPERSEACAFSDWVEPSFPNPQID